MTTRSAIFTLKVGMVSSSKPSVAATIGYEDDPSDLSDPKES